MRYLGNLQEPREKTPEEQEKLSREYGNWMERQLAGMRRWEEKSKKDEGREYASCNSI